MDHRFIELQMHFGFLNTTPIMCHMQNISNGTDPNFITSRIYYFKIKYQFTL